MRAFVNEFVKKELDNFLHKNSETAGNSKRIIQSERERKEIAGIKKLANERAKKKLSYIIKNLETVECI